MSKKKDINYFRQTKDSHYENPKYRVIGALEDGYYSVLFHFNPFKQLWYCIDREQYREYWNGDAINIGCGNNTTEAYESYKKRIAKK